MKGEHGDTACEVLSLPSSGLLLQYCTPHELTLKMTPQLGRTNHPLHANMPAVEGYDPVFMCISEIQCRDKNQPLLAHSQPGRQILPYVLSMSPGSCLS